MACLAFDRTEYQYKKDQLPICKNCKYLKNLKETHIFTYWFFKFLTLGCYGESDEYVCTYIITVYPITGEENFRKCYEMNRYGDCKHYVKK